MKERERRQKQLDIFDNALLRTVESADLMTGTIRQTIINIDRLQRIKKGGVWNAKI